jgi:hypothetical protein
VGGLDLGRQAEIVGRNTDSTWLYVKNPNNPSSFCWLASSFTNATGNIEGLPVVDPPLAVVTRVRVIVNPVLLNVSCNSFPKYVNASAEIATNGPATVSWRWESSAGDFTDQAPLLFLEGKAQAVQEYYKVISADNYWIQVHILSPNDITGRANFKVTCVP